jgi:hypothetical protein
MRNPSIATSASKATPIAADPEVMLLSLPRSFCTAVPSSLSAIFGKAESTMVASGSILDDANIMGSWEGAAG